MQKLLSLICVVGLIFISSCKDDDETKISGQQSAAVQDESVTDAYFNDASDMSTAAYNSPDQSSLGGRTSSNGKTIEFTVTGDTRFTGASLTLVTSGTITAPAGTITIDFGTGKTDAAGTVRKGKILIAYSGFRFVPTSYVSVSFDGYYVNGVKIEGKRTITTATVSNTSISFTVKDENGKATFADGTFVTRVSEHTRKWILPTTSAKGQWEVEGSASGTTRDSKNYTLLITRKLVFKVECALSKIFIPSEGEATLTADLVPITLNYGAAGAACDKIVTVTVLGKTQDVTVE